ncbi:Nif3-like dinuclear metal center hexameric protein [Kiritimatiellota bacterium B12222]|nr:Nif3-like dinuclear metal center hexameric protein [Kiritimatiellota bacterium B12222]
MKILDAHTLQAILENLAPVAGAAEWDNIGLLLEAHSSSPIQKILLTLDLTPAVAQEAILNHVDWIIAYHPPIFSGLKTLTRQNPVTTALLDLLAAGISVYSPHTALDAATEGLSDWLCSAFPQALAENVQGSGRRLVFPLALPLTELTDAITTLIQAPYLRISKPIHTKKIKSLGLCPGAGASVLKTMQVDAVFTGEMRHHDILAWQSAGVAVILSEHGHTERPYLNVFQKRLRAQLPSSVKVMISQADQEPVELLLPHA